MKNFIKTSLNFIKSSIFIISLVISVNFMVSNREAVSIQFFPLPFILETRLFIVMIFCFFAGFFLGLIFLSQNLIKSKINDWKNRKTISN